MTKPKNRVRFSRRSAEPQDPTEEASNEIPRASKQEIRHLIENEGATSTTKIAERLNKDGFPTATAEKWTAALVDSALRRQDMDGLRDLLKENRGDTDEQQGFSLLEIKQAAFDGARDALGDAPREIPPVRINTLDLKAAVAEATEVGLRDVHKGLKEINDSTVLKIHNNVQASLQAADLPGIKRVTDRTATNVNDIQKRIDALCADVYDSTVSTMKEHSKAVIDACETMGVTLYERLDDRFDKLEDKLAAQIVEAVDLDDVVARVVDDRLKSHLDEMANRMAVMVEKLRATLAGDRVRKV